MDIANRLALLAGTLDEAKLPHLSAMVDDAIVGLAKTAQYVGVQGYWVRNERCWQNCYRQKRASTPDKAAQEIWFECQKEYQSSINNDGSKWDKYAGSEKIVKTASFTNQSKTFATAFQARIANGDDAGTAAFSLIENIKNAAHSTLVEASAKVLRVAEAMEGINLLLANEAGTLSNELLKLAWPWSKKPSPAAPNPANDQAAKSLNQMNRPASPVSSPQSDPVHGLEQMSGMSAGSTSFRDLMKNISGEIQKRHAGLSQLSKDFYQYVNSGVQKQINQFVAQNPSPEVKQLAKEAMAIFKDMAGKQRLNANELRAYQGKLDELGARADSATPGSAKEAPLTSPPSAAPASEAHQFKNPALNEARDGIGEPSGAPSPASQPKKPFWETGGILPELGQHSQQSAQAPRRRKAPVAPVAAPAVASKKVELFKLSNKNSTL